MSLQIYEPAGKRGPGVLVVPDIGTPDSSVKRWCQLLAEDGYTAATETNQINGTELIISAVEELSQMLGDSSNIAALAFGIGVDVVLGSKIKFDALVFFDPVTDEMVEDLPVPSVIHSSKSRGAQINEYLGASRGKYYFYENCSPGFSERGHQHFSKWPARIAYSRTLALLRQVMGPYYDLAGLFSEHLRLEFVEKDANATMETMVEEPYVNHIPTRTGGVGKKLLNRFYKYHFIPTQPEDRENTLISETVGADTVVLEIIARFTHDKQMDHMLPGIPPSGRKVELPVVVIASFRGEKLYNEHIYWDQASLLSQIGVLDPTGLPISGAVAAHKLNDLSLPSNELMPNWNASIDKSL